MEDKKVLLSIKDLEVKFRVRGRILTAIRGISLDIYENESIAIVGESGSGKSVFTKTFAGMLDSNGFIDNGSIIFNDDELADTHVRLGGTARSTIANVQKKLDGYSRLEPGAETFRKMVELKAEREIVAIVVPTSLRGPIMEAINTEHGLRSEAQAALCSLPIEQIVRLG